MFEAVGSLQPHAPTRPKRLEPLPRARPPRVHSRARVQHAADAAPCGRRTHAARHDVQLLLHEPAAVRVGRHDRLQGVRAFRVAGREPRVGPGAAAAPQSAPALDFGVDAALPARELRDRPLLPNPTQPYDGGRRKRWNCDLCGPDQATRHMHYESQGLEND